ncbi:MAG: YaiI/YqxD family protein [Legionellaceae bacterium]|nr:YaiI/YqxD family protein [Legionellaceae bacterium]
MKIWIDGDACPKPIKQILFRAAIKRKVPLVIVANHLATTPPSPYIKKVQVSSGFDVADDYIVSQVSKHDLVITGDIILANSIIEKDAIALNPRGTRYSRDNIKQALATRNLNESLRSSGLIQGGPSPMSAKEVQLFSNHLDKLITQAQAIIKRNT